MHFKKVLSIGMIVTAVSASASDYVYEHRSLPAGYKGVVCVKSGSSGYVDLNVLANSSYGFAMETVMAPNSVPGNRLFCGATKVKYGYNGIGLLKYSNNDGSGWGYMYGKSIGSGVALTANTHYLVKTELDPVSRSLQMWDESSALVVNSQTNLAVAEAHGEDVSLYLFTENSAYSTDAPSVFSSTCYYFKLWQVNAQGVRTLVRDLEPCVRESDSVAGFWDFAGKTFFSAAGSSQLVAGDDLPRNRYVSSDGTWYRPGDESGPRYTSLTNALSEASAGDTIWMQDGFVESEGLTTFTENKQTRRVRALVDVANVTLRSESGLVDEAAGKGATIRGTGFTVTGSVTNWSEAVSCLYTKKANIKLIGIILENGATSYEGNKAAGGGLYVSDTTGLVVSNCVIRNCASSLNGGGVSAASATPVFVNCVISNNYAATGMGGGSYGGNHYNGLFADNVAYECGGGLSQANSDLHVVSNCMFVGNRVLHPGNSGGDGGAGGGACFYGASWWYARGVFVDCLFSNNVATAGGGGLYAAGAATNCVFVDNQARFGGGVCGRTGYDYTAHPDWDTNIRLVQCKSLGNTTERNGAGAYHAIAAKCLFAGNTTIGQRVYYGAGAGACDVDLYGCIVSNNTSTSYYVNGIAAGVATDGDESDPAGKVHVCYNTLIVRNTDRGSGTGGAKGSEGSPLMLFNCTVTGNVCTKEWGDKSMGRGGVTGVTLVNSIVYGNQGAGDDTVKDVAKIAFAATNSCATVLTDTTTYPGCVTANPKLDAFYASKQNTCRNAAKVFDWMSDADDVRSKDVYGNARVRGAGPDMGAVETPDYGLMLLVR